MTGRAEQSNALSRTGYELSRLLEADPRVCIVCGFVAAEMTSHVDALFYELVNDIPTRNHLRESGGFCRRHAELVRKQADALGAALIYKDVLGQYVRALEQGQYNRPPRAGRAISRIRDGKRPDTLARPRCPLCKREDEMDCRTLDSLFDALADAEFAGKYRASAGLCLPHFRLGFNRCNDEPAWRIVLETELTTLTGLVDELGELARKFDYRHVDEARGSESDSWLRALSMGAGWPDA